MIPEHDFKCYFQVVERNYCQVNLKNHPECRKGTFPKCNCERWDSYICGHELNHCKSRYDYGLQDDIEIIGIYQLKSVWSI